MMELTPFLLAIAAAFFWGLAQAIGKICLRDLSATVFNVIRFSTVSLVLTPVMLFYGTGISKTWPIFLAVISGFLGLYFATNIYFYIMKRAPLHRVIAIGNSSPFWAVVLAFFLLGERISTILPFSLALVVGGAFLFLPRREEGNGSALAVPITMAVAVLWGLNQVIRKSALESGMGILTFLWISIICAALFLILTAGVTSSWKNSNLSRASVGLSIFSGISGHLLGNFFYLAALGMEGVGALAPLISASIPFGFLLSILIVGERPTRRALIGMVIIFSGVVLAAF